jgi:hypothetical protein
MAKFDLNNGAHKIDIDASGTYFYYSSMIRYNKLECFCCQASSVKSNPLPVSLTPRSCIIKLFNGYIYEKTFLQKHLENTLKKLKKYQLLVSHGNTIFC